tara:strand:+ start:405 stop:1634 length:1230 start_codon:yes stop_codon:yes gene_type:complete
LFTKAERLISYRNLKPKRKEGFLKLISVFSFLGIMLGVAILIIVMSVMNGFRTDLTNKLLGLNPHIVVEPNSSTISQDFEKSIGETFKEFTISRSYSGEGIILSKNNTKGVIIKGVNQKDLDIIFRKNELINKNLNSIKKGGVIIGGELAFNLNLNVGDRINLLTSSFIDTPIGSVPKQETFIITGIFNSGFYEFDQSLIYLNLSDALSLFEQNLDESNLDIYINKPLDADIYKDKIQEMDLNLFVYSWSDLNKSFFSALKVERNVMFIILTLIIIVAAFNIVSGLTILIKNKTKEIAILKTLGVSNFSIKKIFFLSGFIIGFVATLTGIFFGILFSIYIENIRNFLSSVLNINIFPADVYFLDKMPSEINIFSVFLIFLCSIIVTAIASYLPARSISKMQIINALKYE